MAKNEKKVEEIIEAPAEQAEQTPEIIDTVESLEAKLAAMRKAQGIFAT